MKCQTNNYILLSSVIDNLLLKLTLNNVVVFRKKAMNSIRDKVIECLSKEWEQENDTWESPEGKLIPYLRFSKFIMPENNDFDRYHIAFTIWAKNVSVEIIESCGECGPEIDSDERWAMIRIFRIAKVPHAEFLERSDELIQLAYRKLYENFNP